MAEPAKVSFTPDTRVKLRELTVVREEGRDPLLGAKEVKVFVEVDEDSLAAVEAIRATDTLGDAEARILRETGEEVDVVDFAEFLHERGLVSHVDGAETVVAAAKKGGRTMFGNVPESAVRWIHSRPVLWSVPILAACAISAMLADATLRPSYMHLFVLPRPGLTVIVTFLVMLLNTYVHELAHLFMARSFGVESSIRISNRMHILVMETDVTNAWVLPARKRALIFLAGMSYNAIMLSASVLLVAAGSTGLLPMPAWAFAALRFFAVVNLLPIVFQFFVWMRTDLYFALLALTGERNLLADSRSYVKHLVRRTWAAIRGRLEARCEGCDAKRHGEDPFCFRCGATTPEGAAAGLRYRVRHLYLGYGALIFVSAPYMTFVMVRSLFYFQVENLRRMIAGLANSLDGGNGWLIAESGVMLVITVLQLGLIAYFVIPGLVKSASALVTRALLLVRGDRPVHAGRAGASLALVLLVGLLAIAAPATGLVPP